MGRVYMRVSITCNRPHDFSEGRVLYVLVEVSRKNCRHPRKMDLQY